MRPSIGLLGMLLLGTVSGPSHAQVNLGWDACGTGAVMNRDFACDTNAGEFHLIGSFVAPATVDSLWGMEVVIDLCSMEPVLPSWWQYWNTATCRENSLSASAALPAAAGECLDTWADGAVGGISAYQLLTRDWNSARLLIAYATPAGATLPLAEGAEYFAFDVRIDARSTVGTAACQGCTAGVCIILNQITLAQPIGSSGGDVALTHADRSQYVTWQGGVKSCPFVVPARASTWARVKGMYR